MTITAIFIVSGFLIAFYLFICNRVTAAMHPMRMKLAALGTELANSEGMPEDIQDMINFALDRAYSTSVAWVHVIVMPVAVALTIRDQILGSTHRLERAVPADKRDDFDLFCFLSTVSTMANSPIAAILFAVETFVFMVLWLPIGEILRQTNIVTAALEQKTSRLSHRWAQPV